MIFLHITAAAKNAHILNNYVADGKHVFALIYMDGCGPCNATRPEWAKLKSTLEYKYKSNDNVIIADINSDALKEVNDFKNIQGFPTILFICNKGNKNEEFEKGKQLNKTRTVDAFIEWIEINIKHMGLKGYKNNKNNKTFKTNNNKTFKTVKTYKQRKNKRHNKNIKTYKKNMSKYKKFKSISHLDI